MKRNSIFIAIGVFILPVLMRGLWFYRGWYRAPSTLAAPSYDELTMPVPPAGSEPPSDEIDDYDGRIVLVDRAHSNRFDLSELDVLFEGLTARGASVEFVLNSYEPGELPLSERLKYAHAYIVIAPMETIDATTVQQVDRFVSRGGRLLVISDPTRNISDYYFDDYADIYFVEAISANSLLAPFDIAFADDFLYNLIEYEANFRNVLFHQFAEDAITVDLSELAFYGARSIKTHTGTPLIVGDDDTRSSRSDTTAALAVAVRSADGGAVAIGDLTFLTRPYHQVADNQRFISNLIDFLLDGERSVDLTDYPYVFRDSVTLLRTESFDLAADTVEIIAGIQSSFNARGQTLTLSDGPEEDSDLIVLSPFAAEDVVLDMLESVDGLVIPDDFFGPLSVPHFGEIEPYGIGVILLNQTAERTTLFLLAETSDDLLELAAFLELDRIDGCVIRENVALCKAGLGMDYDFGFEEYEYEFDDSLLDDFQLEGDDVLPPTEAAVP